MEVFHDKNYEVYKHYDSYSAFGYIYYAVRQFYMTIANTCTVLETL